MTTAAAKHARASAIDRLERPRLGKRVVERGRLFEWLDHPPATLTLVSAPAGAGKTTLLLSWLGARGRERPIAWLAARAAEDGDAFWQAAADAVAAALGLERLQRPNEPALDAVLRTFVRLETPLALVVDDFHEVASPLVLEPLARIAEWGPEMLHVVLACRHDPDLPLHRLRLAGRLAELRARDLAFTPDEADALLRASGVELDGDSACLLHERTDGWAAAIGFAAISLAAASEPESFVSALGRSEHAVADYLVREVLAAQPPALRDFLLRTSLCDRMDGGLADAVTGGGDGARTLDALERDNVFVELRPDGRWYRYNPLFGELLRTYALRELGDELSSVHAAARRWLAAEGFRLDALRHALAGGDAAAAAELVGGLWLELSACGGLEPSLIEQVSLDDVLARPQLCLLTASTRLQSGELAEADAWLAAADRVADPDERPFRVGRGLVALHRARLLGDVERLDLAIAELARPEALAERAADGDARRALVLAARGVSALWSGDLVRAQSRLEAAVDGARRGRLVALENDATASLALVCALRGELRRAARLARSQRGESVFSLTALAICELEWDDAPKAERLAERARDLGEAAGDRAGVLVAQLVAARALLGTTDAVEEARLRVAAIAEDPFRPLPLLEPDALLLRCRIALASADPMSACGLLADAEDSPHRAVAAARLAVATGDRDGAQSELEPVLADRVDAPLALRVEAAVLRSLSAATAGDHDEGCDWIETALDLAEAEAIRRPFREGGGAAAGVLRRTIRRGSAHRWLAGAILAALDGREEEHGHARRELLDPLSDRELVVLRYLPTLMSNREIAGELFLSVNTVKTHLKSIYRKLDASDRREAVRAARELRLVG